MTEEQLHRNYILLPEKEVNILLLAEAVIQGIHDNRIILVLGEKVICYEALA